MRTVFCLMTLLLIGLGAWAMNTIPADEAKIDPTALKGFATQTNQFGYDLFSQIRRTPGNLFISPYSISSALAMSSTGAKGQTAEQMSKVLHLSTSAADYSASHQSLMTSLLQQPKGYDIRIANAIWGQNLHPFKEDFVSRVQKFYRAEGRTLDFVKDTENSRQTINRWVETQTNDRIKDLLPQGSLSELTRLVLTNAIYFKGTWETPFNKSNTRPVEFALAPEHTIKTDMMYRSGSMRIAETDELQALELPYQGGRLSMVVLLPRKKDGLADLESILSTEKVTHWIQGMKTAKVNLTLPRIKTNFTIALSKPLQAMGMVDAFDGNKADFSGIDGTRELFISEVFHKTFCEVNEEGTEAAAATGAVFAVRSAAPRPETPIEFKADHPYLYMIRDTQTGSLLFLGRVADPRN